MASKEIAPRIAMSVRQTSPLTPVYDRYSTATMRLDNVEPVLTEVVRLRCAHVHDCRLCGSVRLVAARDGGLDEDAISRIDDYDRDDVDPRWRAALRLTDAMTLAPREIDAALRAEVREHFSDAEISEILLDIVKWSYQKALVSLRIEPPFTDGRTNLQFDESGNAVRG